MDIDREAPTGFGCSARLLRQRQAAALRAGRTRKSPGVGDPAVLRILADTRLATGTIL